MRPRVQRLLQAYPLASTTSAFLKLLEEKEGPQRLLQWSGARKIDTLLSLTRLLAAGGVETEDDFGAWIAAPGNLARLREIKDKTANYIEILLGGENVAVGRHLFRFLSEAGLPTTSYEDAHAAIRDAAERLGVSVSSLDHSIWRYIAERAPESAHRRNGDIVICKNPKVELATGYACCSGMLRSLP